MLKLISVGLDVGTTTTQLIVSELQIENRASSFSVPQMQIVRREIVYQSPVHFTPLLDKDHVDGEGIRRIVEAEYQNAGISPADVDTGAIIITGETARKENARAVLEALERYAGEFVVATAGPDLESILAAKGAGADRLSEATGKTVLHMDIGGGTSNFTLLKNGNIVKTGCLNVGGRLLKFDDSGRISYISPVLDGIFQAKIREKPSFSNLEALTARLAEVLEMAAGLRPPTPLLQHFVTEESSACGLTGANIFSFSGGVADCINTPHQPLSFGDIGPLLGQAIRKSRLCQGSYRLGTETIRATVIGAGCHAAQLSGSTVFYRDIAFPLKNLPVFSVEDPTAIQAGLNAYDTTPVLAFTGAAPAHYSQICTLADAIVRAVDGPVYVALQADFAKALGHALALRTQNPILCIDRVQLEIGSFLDVGAPAGSALPVVIKTLVLPSVGADAHMGPSF